LLSSDTVCDVDVSPYKLMQIVFDLPAEKKSKLFRENNKTKAFDKANASPKQTAMNNALQHVGYPSKDEKHVLQEITYADRDFQDVRMELTNMFRIYPTIPSRVLQGSGLNKVFGVIPGEPKVDRRLATQDDSCMYAKNGKCDEPPRCPNATDCSDCGKCGIANNWQQEVLRTAVFSKAYVAHALAQMETRSIGPVVTRWFGNNVDSPTRTEVKRVLSGIQSLLNNVDYIYPGDECDKNTLAYVYPSAPWNKNGYGQYIFYLCELYMHSNRNQQIEILTHEGSHHISMLTDDTTWAGTTMYGRYLCAKVAEDCQTGDPAACTKVLRNADNFCYFINDAVHDAIIPLATTTPMPSPTKPGFQLVVQNIKSWVTGSLR